MAQEPHRKRKREDEETLSLYDAIRQEKLETVQQLLEEKAEVSGAEGGQLLCTAVYGKNPEILIALLKAKADPNQIDRLSDASSSILQRAILYKKPFMVSALLTYKASFRLTDGHGHNALDYAATFGCTNMVELLLAAKADTTTDGLRNAAASGFTAIIKLLLENQADIHSQDNNQQTALSRAAIAGHEEIVSQLLAAKANAQMPLHQLLGTPLVQGQSPIKETIVLALIKAKASCSLKDGDGNSALDLVRQHKRDDKITQLIKKCYEREVGLAFLSGLHPRTGASSLLTSLARRSSLFDRQVLRIPLKLAASTPDPNPAPRRGK